MVPVMFPAEDGAPCHRSALRLAVCAGSAAKPPPVLGWDILLCSAAACCMCCASGTPGSGVICGTAPLRAAAERCCGPCRAGWPAGHARPVLPSWPEAYPAVLAELAAEAFSRAPGPPGGKPIKPCSGAGLLCASCCCGPRPEADCACKIMSYRSECHIIRSPCPNLAGHELTLVPALLIRGSPGAQALAAGPEKQREAWRHERPPRLHQRLQRLPSSAPGGLFSVRKLAAPP